MLMCQCGRRWNGEVPSSGGKSSAAPRLGMEHHVLASTRTAGARQRDFPANLPPQRAVRGVVGRPYRLFVVADEEGINPAVEVGDGNTQPYYCADLSGRRTHGTVRGRGNTIEPAIGQRRQTRSGMRRSHSRIGQLDNASVVENEPGVSAVSYT